MFLNLGLWYRRVFFVVCRGYVKKAVESSSTCVFRYPGIVLSAKYIILFFRLVPCSRKIIFV